MLNKSKPYRFILLPLLKGSPLHPFFNYNYNKLRQNGALFRFHLKWANKDDYLKCEANSLDPISIQKMGPLLLLQIRKPTFCQKVTVNKDLKSPS